MKIIIYNNMIIKIRNKTIFSVWIRIPGGEYFLGSFLRDENVPNFIYTEDRYGYGLDEEEFGYLVEVVYNFNYINKV